MRKMLALARIAPRSHGRTKGAPARLCAICTLSPSALDPEIGTTSSHPRAGPGVKMNLRAPHPWVLKVIVKLSEFSNTACAARSADAVSRVVGLTGDLAEPTVDLQVTLFAESSAEVSTATFVPSRLATA